MWVLEGFFLSPISHMGGGEFKISSTTMITRREHGIFPNYIVEIFGDEYHRGKFSKSRSIDVIRSGEGTRKFWFCGGGQSEKKDMKYVQIEFYLVFFLVWLIK
mgnify:CR=1 FL=1